MNHATRYNCCKLLHFSTFKMAISCWICCQAVSAYTVWVVQALPVSSWGICTPLSLLSQIWTGKPLKPGTLRVWDNLQSRDDTLTYSHSALWLVWDDTLALCRAVSSLQDNYVYMHYELCVFIMVDRGTVYAICGMGRNLTECPLQ